jgi:hypothetical protein
LNGLIERIESIEQNGGDGLLIPSSDTYTE